MGGLSVVEKSDPIIVPTLYSVCVRAPIWATITLPVIDKLTAEIMADLGKLGIDPGALNSANNSFKKNLANSLNALITGLKTPAPAAPAPAAPAPAAQPAPVAQPAPAAPTPSP